jgi:hypothetical protein
MGTIKTWLRPGLNPLPVQTGSLENHLVSLNGGGWKLNLSPPSDFHDFRTIFSEWEDIVIPFQVETGENEYAYARSLQIPLEWKDHRIFLRFDGVNCYTRLFVDGVFIRDHYGGFVSWDCELTDRVIPGQEHRLVLGVTDKPGEICSFHRGGIIRDVTIYALPCTYLARLHAETVFDADYKDADLKVSLMSAGGDASADMILLSPDGTLIALGKVSCKAGEDIAGIFHVSTPLKWDSEHPWLYTLSASLTDDRGFLEKTERKIGFRQIERRGNEVYVNGDLLKLRGINRHDIYPTSGRAITRELVEEDVRLFKEANINFIRTSHYPPRPDFLDFCDKYGIYVEDEIAVAFIGYGVRHTESDPEYTARFMDQFTELIERDRSHPCVIIWSLANESFWGENIAKMNAYAHAEDPSRLTIFSFPINQREDDELPDIWSFHYSGIDKDLTALADAHWRSYREQVPMPVLHDESTHVPCYDIGAMRRDPGIRDFWGETILRYWDMLWEKKGALGCAIWAGIDDAGERGSLYNGYAWGIIDGWRRKKPEYWHTRKAYSPIRLKGLPESRKGKISMFIQNRFNHTNLNEIEINWIFNGSSGKCPGPDIQPRGEGWLEIPVPFVPGKKLELSFTDPFGNPVDEASYTLNEQRPGRPSLDRGSPPGWEKKGGEVRIHGRDFSLNFSDETGLITCGTYRGLTVLTGGPALNLVGLPLGPWHLEKMDVGQEKYCVRVSLDGYYGKVAVRFVILIDNNGLMETTYTITDIPYPSPRQIAISNSIVSHAGGYDEVGVAFTVPRELDTLTWKRNGLWNVYPDWHIGRLTGKVSKFKPRTTNTPDIKPDWDWRLDDHDWILFGQYEIGRRGVRDFISTKASFYEVSLERNASSRSDGVMFTALSDGSEAARMELCFNPRNIISDRDPAVVYQGNWLRQDTKFRSRGGTETWSKTAGDYCQYSFLGTGFAWVSSLDAICGMADVYVDGQVKAKDIDLGLSGMGKTPRMYEKYYRHLVFSVQDMPMGEHTVRIEVSGKNAPGSANSFVNIDHFLILNGEETGDTRFIINSEFNYPCLSWGTYIKPAIKVGSGYSRKIYTKLGCFL